MAQFDKHQLEITDQQMFTDSFNVCWELLKNKEYYLCERETDIFSRLSLNYGQDMYDAMVIIINKIIKSNEHKAVIEKSKVASIQNVTTEATCDSGYDDNYDQLNQKQQQQQVDKVNVDIDNSHDNMISKKRKISVDEIHSKKMFEADNKKNTCNDSSNAENIQITSSMIDIIEKEEKLFIEESITIKDELLPITDDSIDVDKMNNSNDHSIRLEIKSNEISNEHQINTRIRTRSLAFKKCSFCTEDDDELSFTQDDDDIDDDNDDDVVGNSLNQNEKLKNKIKVSDQTSFKERARVVKLALKNPTWSLSMLREHSGCMNIRNSYQVKMWKKQIERGGTLCQKMNFVNNWVVNKCIESRKKKEIITNAKIRTWGLEAKKLFKPKNFTAGDGWLQILKKNHDITGESNDLTINCNLRKKNSLSDEVR